MCKMTSKRKGIYAASLAVLVAVAFRPTSLSVPQVPKVHCTLADSQAALQRFSGALKFRTTSSREAPNNIIDEREMHRLHAYLESSFKTAFQHVSLQKVKELSLLLKWEGSNASLKPAVFISHLDVVPVGEEAAWTHPPYSGAIADGYVWGRGAQDVKVTVTQLLEAATLLIGQGFKPERTAYFSFGHDEEVGGTGSSASAHLLASQGVTPEVILDEGGVLLVDGLKGITHVPTAVIGVAEKGYVSMEVSIKGEGGHSSTPLYGRPDVISQAAAYLQTFKSHPPPIQAVDPVPSTFAALAAGVRVPALKWLLSSAHRWPFRNLLGYLLSRSKSAEVAALVRSTAAVVDIRTSPAGDNVMPDTALISFNFRTLPGEKLNWPMGYLKWLGRRAGIPEHAVTIRQTVTDAYEASSVTDVSGLHFSAVKAALLETMAPPEGLLVAPNLLNGKTDSAQYLNVFPGTPVLRFSPVPTNMTAGDLKGIHGVNERCSIEGYLQGVCFYVQVFKRLLKAQL